MSNNPKTTWHHIRRSPIQSLTALILMTFSFMLVSLFIVVNSGLSKVLVYFETKPEITIFIKDNLPQADIDNLQKDLANYQDVKEIKFISKEKALEIYKQQNKNNPMLTEMVTASILPASFEITVTDPKTLEKIYQNYATNTNVVDEIIYQKDVINSLLDWTNIIRRSGFIITIIVFIISFFSVSTIIGMKTTNRKDEIKISRLLGASKFYVKKPFLLEGIFYGLIGSFIGSILTLTLIYFVRTSINTFFQPVVFIPNELSFYGLVILAQLLLGLIIGFFSSLIGVRRYIKF
ncbi:MAG: permease-like cell division protein FtsX [Candidatus Shapirobacteria bacterium]|jgi:cell division transport system permease protein|nr:permease-like cell division protein FtsX [Candidatus Shapirobacteria bacterium]